MDNLYKENSMKLNNEIAKEQKKYIKYGKYAEWCDVAFKGLSIGHVVITGIYSLGIIVPAMLSMTIPPLITPTVIGLIGSCAVSVSLSAMLGRFFEKKQEKASKRFDTLEHMKRNYEAKPVQYKESLGNMKCKNIIPSCTYSKENGFSLSLKK